ncbi:NXPE family member 1-like [Huso huso]|uniref:NXPE family member 1-like n=1 Tax=Huso huso TaxID=61971 RepID=A0ABR0Y3X5_HUSHU
MAGAEITLNMKFPLSSFHYKNKKVVFLFILAGVILMHLLQPGKWFDRPPLLPPNPRLHDTARAIKAEVKEILQALKRHVPAVNQTQVELSSSGAHSLVTLMNPKENYCVGEIVSVRVEMNDYWGKPKTYGGDFILARIHSPELKAGAAGVPEDFNNGTYRVNFTLFWPGSVKVSVLLIHSSEVLSTLWQAKEYCNDKFIFTGTFRNSTLQETSRCDIHLSTNETVCEFKDERNQESFFCFKPKTLPCETLHCTSSNNRKPSCLAEAEIQILERFGFSLLYILYV